MRARFLYASHANEWKVPHILVDRMKGAIAITSWICVTVIIALVFWTYAGQLDFFGMLLFIFFLYAIPFVLSVAAFSER